MIIHNVIQKTPEWHRIRAFNFTASTAGPFAIEPCRVNLTVEDIKQHLDLLGILRKGLVKRDDLLAALPNADQYRQLTPGARTAIIQKITDIRIQKIRDKSPDERSEWDAQTLAWQDEIDAQRERQMGYNIPVQRGNLLEPDARHYYEQRTGHKVIEFGFIEHDTKGWGCSPDGLCLHKMFEEVSSNPSREEFSHGLEIKCPMPSVHMGYLLDGELPEEYKIQTHLSMAATGLTRWDFLSYCPGDAPLLLEVHRDEFTDQLEAGMIELVAHKARIQARLAEMWNNEFTKP